MFVLEGNINVLKCRLFAPGQVSGLRNTLQCVVMLL